MLHRAQPGALAKDGCYCKPDPGDDAIVLMNGRIVLTHLAWYALSLARMRVRPGGFTYVLLQDFTVRSNSDRSSGLKSRPGSCPYAPVA